VRSLQTVENRSAVLFMHSFQTQLGVLKEFLNPPRFSPGALISWSSALLSLIALIRRHSASLRRHFVSSRDEMIQSGPFWPLGSFDSKQPVRITRSKTHCLDGH
jgi:hypothetical protein